MTRSLQTRLLAGIIATIVSLLAIFSLTVYFVIHSALTGQFDASLASIARILAASVELDGNKVEIELEAQLMPEFQNSKHPAFYQLWAPDGTVAARSPLVEGDDLPRSEADVGELVFRDSCSARNLPIRTASLKFKPRTADGGQEGHARSSAEHVLTLAVARDQTGLLSQLRFLRWLLLITSLTVVVLSLLIAAIVVRQGLVPLKSIAREIAAIDIDDLAIRIGAESTPVEVIPIRDRLNDLLTRLEEAFNRERRLTADVAHELRTPLAGLRSTIEVALSRRRDSTEYEASLSDCLSIAESMHTTVSDLLMLARLDAHKVTLWQQELQPAKLIDSAWLQLADKAARHKIVFENRIPTVSTCQSDPEQLATVFRNLLDNAAEYSNEGGQIWVDSRRVDDSVEITIANTGCRLTAEQVSRVFDSFWRADSSRTDAGVHSGLGLALVERIVTTLGGTITAETEQPDIFMIRLALPISAMSDRSLT